MSRLGLHYYPDSLHYSQKDLQTWLPAWQELGITWLTLVGSPARAIPESFLSEVLGAGIEPVIHIPLPVAQGDYASVLAPVFKVYADWGVKYVALFDRPNLRSAWTPEAWAALDLVERFLDNFIPLGKMLLSCGITPVFPPLEPGGDYWDTAYLSAALNALVRRNQVELVDRLVLGAYGWFHERSLDWGIGGPERWPSSQPYGIPQTGEDHRGFRIFDWYQAIAEAITGRRKRVILLKAGHSEKIVMQTELPTHEQVALMKLVLALRGDEKAIRPSAPKYAFELDEWLMACNFWLMATPKGHAASNAAWFDETGRPAPFTRGLKKALAMSSRGKAPVPENFSFGAAQPGSSKRPFTHYVLLPPGNQEVIEQCLNTLRPAIETQRVTAGYSLLEAALARHVICCDGGGYFEPSQIEQLQRAGCQIHKTDPNGINLAHYLASLENSIYPNA